MSMTWGFAAGSQMPKTKDWLICSTGILAWYLVAITVKVGMGPAGAGAAGGAVATTQASRRAMLCALSRNRSALLLEMHPHCLVLHGMALHGNGMDQVSQTIQNSHELCAVQLSMSGTCCTYVVYIPRWLHTGTAPSYIVCLSICTCNPS